MGAKSHVSIEKATRHTVQPQDNTEVTIEVVGKEGSPRNPKELLHKVTIQEKDQGESSSRSEESS